MQDLIGRWKKLKEEEAATIAERWEVEKEIEKKLGEGIHHVDGNKVTIRLMQNYKVDAPMWESIKDTIPERLRPVRYLEKVEADFKGVKWLEENEPGLWKIAAKAITVKPGKTQVKIEEEA